MLVVLVKNFNIFIYLFYISNHQTKSYKGFGPLTHDLDKSYQKTRCKASSGVLLATRVCESYSQGESITQIIPIHKESSRVETGDLVGMDLGKVTSSVRIRPRNLQKGPRACRPPSTCPANTESAQNISPKTKIIACSVDTCPTNLKHAKNVNTIGSGAKRKYWDHIMSCNNTSNMYK